MQWSQAWVLQQVAWYLEEEKFERDQGPRLEVGTVAYQVPTQNTDCKLSTKLHGQPSFMDVNHTTHQLLGKLQRVCTYIYICIRCEFNVNELYVSMDACAFLYYKLELAFVSSHEFSNS